MAGRVGERHHAAKGRAEDDGPLYLQRIAESPDIVAPLRQGPAFARPALAPAVAAVIEVHNLDHVGELREAGLVPRVIHSRAAMEKQEGWLLAHRGEVGRELLTLDIEEQPYPIDLHVHAVAFLPRSPSLTSPPHFAGTSPPCPLSGIS